MAVTQLQILKLTFMQRDKEWKKKVRLLKEICSHVNHRSGELVFPPVKHMQKINQIKYFKFNQVDTFWAKLKKNIKGRERAQINTWR